jgi:hypothetical protein
MVHVPIFVDGPVANGWRGNGSQLYQCYIQAFVAAHADRTNGILPDLVNTLPDEANRSGGMDAANLPRTIAFSFVGPSYGWDPQEAANIAICALYDAFWYTPAPAAVANWNINGLTQAVIDNNRDRFTEVAICAKYSPSAVAATYSAALLAAYK